MLSNAKPTFICGNLEGALFPDGHPAAWKLAVNSILA
jgi:hypothetical protein